MSAPTLPPESWWEAHFFPHLEALVGQAVRDLAALVAGTGSGTGAAGAVHGPQAFWPLPMDPLTVARLAMTAGIPGVTKPVFPRQVVTAPANGTATFTLPVAPGTVIVQVGSFRGFTSVHDPAILATILTDNQNLELASVPATADIDTILPAYAVVRNEVTATFQNGTPNPVTFTIDPQMAIVDANEYDQVWAPLFVANYQLLRTMAQAIRQAGGTGA